MVCDYFIERFLEIEHKNGISYYGLYFECKWFPCIDECYEDFQDSDNEPEVYTENKEYDRVCKELEVVCLMPRQSRIIFKDGEFINEKIKEKYLPLILKKVNNNRLSGDNKDTGLFADIKDIIKVTKKELRYRQCEYFIIHPDK